MVDCLRCQTTLCHPLSHLLLCTLIDRVCGMVWIVRIRVSKDVIRSGSLQAVYLNHVAPLW